MAKFPVGSRVRHVKTQNVYRIVMDRSLCRIEATGLPAYAYTAVGRRKGVRPIWVRPADEMEDGRFVRVRRLRRKAR